MQSGDPSTSFQQLCHTSSSQEQHLARCPFAGDEFLSVDGEPGSAGTGIVMLSLPDSPDEEENGAAGTSRNDAVFHSPPQVSSSLPVSQVQQPKNVAVDVAVNSGLGFSAKVKVTETIEIDLGSQSSHGAIQFHDNKVIHSESIIFRIEDGLSETPGKKLKIVYKDLGFKSPEPRLCCEAAKTLERVAKSIEKLISPSKRSIELDENVVLQTPNRTARRLNFEGASPSNCLNSLENEIVNGIHGDGSARRILNEISESQLEAVNENRTMKSTEDDMDNLDNLRNVGPCGENSCGKRKDSGEKRALPVSLLRNNLNAQGDQVESTRRSDNKKKSMAVFDVLRELSKKYSFDPSLAKLSALEAAKRGGMTFP